MLNCFSRFTALVSVFAVVTTGACSNSGDGTDDDRVGPGGKADDLSSCTTETQQVGLVEAFSGLEFRDPIGLYQAPDSDRWYVAEKRGVIWTLVASADGTTSQPPTVFADLRSSVHSTPNEAGLLGVAFSPDFATDGRVYLSYTVASTTSQAGLRSRLSRWQSRDNGLTLDTTSEQPLLGLEQPFENHNGGHIAFGPDGFLYLGFGDGGFAGDPGNRAQNTSSPFGKLLRIDVSGPDEYEIPADNPFASGGGLAEIYAWGLRNPWRFSFDSQTGRLWLADVGQDQFEEINIIERGGNYGWKVREAGHCFDSTSCSTSGLIDPVIEYDHSEGFSVTGGFVYRGSGIPALVGSYLFADFGSGRLWAAHETANGFTPRVLGLTGRNPSAFGQSHDGEIFLVDFTEGGITKIVGQPCSGRDNSNSSINPSTDTAGDSAPDSSASSDSFQNLYDTVLRPNCGPCHTARAFGGLSMPRASDGLEALVNRDATTAACAGRRRVIPGDPDNSVLFQKISGVNMCGSLMPPSGALSGADIEKVRSWIEQGANP